MNLFNILISLLKACTTPVAVPEDTGTADTGMPSSEASTEECGFVWENSGTGIMTDSRLTFELLTPTEVELTAGDELVIEFSLTADPCGDIELIDVTDLVMLDPLASGWTQDVLQAAILENLDTVEVFGPSMSGYSVDQIEHDFTALHVPMTAGVTHLYRLTFPSAIAAPTGLDFNVLFGSITWMDMASGEIVTEDLSSNVTIHVPGEAPEEQTDPCLYLTQVINDLGEVEEIYLPNKLWIMPNSASPSGARVPEFGEVFRFNLTAIRPDCPDINVAGMTLKAITSDNNGPDADGIDWDDALWTEVDDLTIGVNLFASTLPSHEPAPIETITTVEAGVTHAVSVLIDTGDASAAYDDTIQVELVADSLIIEVDDVRYRLVHSNVTGGSLVF